MSDGARARILERLAAARPKSPAISDFAVVARKQWAAEARYPRLRFLMEAVHSEFLEATEAGWPLAIREFLAEEGLSTLLYGPGTAAAGRLEAAWAAGTRPSLVAYDRPIESEDLKRRLFEDIDAGFTTTRGGIADTGGLILWPTPDEPRLLSLVPPVHIALLDSRSIHNTFWEAMRVEGWASGMPPNALLISGPSKTADIEQTLAYGVHGPKRLLVVAILPES
ncbi:MAG: lactate utilization protein [Acidobacteria bacterium]|nr:lactate utilization protein [Acidobacteriota bacterium]